MKIPELSDESATLQLFNTGDAEKLKEVSMTGA